MKVFCVMLSKCGFHGLRSLTVVCRDFILSRWICTGRLSNAVYYCQHFWATWAVSLWRNFYFDACQDLVKGIAIAMTKRASTRVRSPVYQSRSSWDHRALSRKELMTIDDRFSDSNQLDLRHKLESGNFKVDRGNQDGSGIVARTLPP